MLVEHVRPILHARHSALAQDPQFAEESSRHLSFEMAPKDAKVSDHHDVPLQMLSNKAKAAASLGSASADPRASSVVRSPNAPASVQGEARAQVGDASAQPIDQSIFAPQVALQGAVPPPPPPMGSTFSEAVALPRPGTEDAAQTAATLLERGELDEQLGLSTAAQNAANWSGAAASAVAVSASIHIQHIKGHTPNPEGLGAWWHW